ncbi:MAG TPA: hypothetical protein VE981_21175 [Planctomycetota bacterium]|nr:hypothetical protein [Planctomycetota bacterium]
MFATAALLVFSALQADREATVQVRDSEITVVLPEKTGAVSREQILAWAKACGETVAGYFGDFPVPKVRLELTSKGRGAIRSGRTWNGRLIRVELGSGTKEEDFRDDWLLTHEMCHLAFPDLDEKHAWMYEGFATYVEPIARVRSGRLTVEAMWKQILEGMPKGVPEAKDGGMDGTTEWGRTYWGGAYYWLMADLGIREKTKGKETIQTALQAILKAGGDGRRWWSIDDVVAKGDEATGTTVMSELYKEMGKGDYRPDLQALWRKLGVERRGKSIAVDDQAPQAELRRALTSK